MSKKALFLDRDGVINVDRGYVHRREDFEWLDGIFDIARSAVAAGYHVIVVSNQSGIARGMFTESAFEALTAWMCGVFKQNGVGISRVYYAPFHEQSLEPNYRDDVNGWRKPKPGMLLQAKADLDIDLSQSILIGDQWSDAQAARSAGVGQVVIIGTPKDDAPDDAVGAYRFPTVREATNFLAAEFANSRA